MTTNNSNGNKQSYYGSIIVNNDGVAVEDHTGNGGDDDSLRNPDFDGLPLIAQVRGGVGGSSLGIGSSSRRRRRSSSGNSISSSIRLALDTALDSSLRFGGPECSIRSLGGRASSLATVANITKNLIGCGVLSLSGGIAIYANSPSAIVEASFWIVVLGAMFGYFFLILAKICRRTGAATYRECWEQTMGDTGALMVSIVNALKPALGNLAYSTILSQTLKSLLETVGVQVTRIEALLLITIVAILPLCLLKNTAVLTPFSVVGTAGIIITAIGMGIRCVDGSYNPGGAYHEDIAPEYQPSFGTRNAAWSGKVLPYICMIFEAFVAHYNSPRFYTELEHASIPRFQNVVVGSFGLSAVLYICIAAAGYLTFGQHADSYILNNYSPSDPVATVCRLMIAMSTLLVYPLTFIGFRDGVLDILELEPERQTAQNINVLTVVLLTIITGIAVVCADLGQINSVGGGLFSTAVVFVFPALMYRRVIQMAGDRRGGSILPEHQREVQVVMALMAFGILVGAVGVKVSIEEG